LTYLIAKHFLHHKEKRLCTWRTGVRARQNRFYCVWLKAEM
jgi:hypothetical protein